MSLQKIKRTTYIALTLLLVCTVMLGAVSYAWLSMSRAPEIAGMDVNVGANGSLEIALLTESTFIDPTTIRTKVGSSLADQEAMISNLSWGNVIDLNDSGYGLSHVSLVPARLSVTDALVVNSGLLMVPGYGADGRFTELSTDTASGVYTVDQFGTGTFAFSTAGQSYGVRGIGKLAGVSAQESALATSRTAVQAYGNAAKSDIVAIWEDNGPGLLEVIHYLHGGKQGTLDLEPTLLLMKDTAQRLLVVYDYLDSALRQGIIGYASLMVDGAEEFKMIKQNFENKQIALTVLLDMIPLTGPFQYEATARVIEDDVAQLNRLIAACDEGFELRLLPSYFDTLVETDDAYINDTLVRKWQTSGVNLTEDNILTLYAGHDGNGGYVLGALHRVVQFVGEYSTFFQYDGVSVEVRTVLDPTLSPVIDTVYDILDQQDDTNDEGYVDTQSLDDVCGFAIDMAFRCNQECDLLLQTMPEVRVEGDEYPELNNTQGGGSFMRFQSGELTTEQVVGLVDALRIGFLDNRNNLIAVAKLNTSNYQETEDGVTAPLYLYDFTAYADGRIEMGERRSENCAVTSLSQNQEKVISVVVWLDGDHIDNSHAATIKQSMTGTLNLQFASSADLKPMGPNSSPIPDETEPTIPENDTTYYLSIDDSGRYIIYTLDEAGKRDYEMPFVGTHNESAHTLTINSVTEYPEVGIFIPAVVTDLNDDVQYAVSISAEKPFEKLGAECREIAFISENGIKASVSGDNLSDFLAGVDGITIFYGEGLETSNVTNMSHLFDGCKDLKWVYINEWNTKNVTNMSHMFNNCSSLERIDISGFYPINVTNMSFMFNGCAKINMLDLCYNTWSVTNTSSMFKGCSNLTELDISNLDVSSVVDLSYMFYGCSSLTKLNMDYFYTICAENMSFMFAECSDLIELDVSGLKTGLVVNMSSMFSGCNSLTGLDVSNFDTARVTDMSAMFAYCSSLAELDVSGFDTTDVTNMGSMFFDCSRLKDLDVSGFITSNVTNMAAMFGHCSGLHELDVSGFDTSDVTNMGHMFSDCSSLSKLDVSGFETANVTDMTTMFGYCSNLTELDVGSFNTACVTDMSYMFYGCSSLSELTVKEWNISNVTNMNSMFWDCENLMELDISAWDVSDVETFGMFYNCPAGKGTGIV